MQENKFIELKGVRQHNLKNISLKIPQNKLIVITGVSGSGKSSLAFDTIYAEGQRRYVESLSSYIRQFMAKIDKPEVDFISGIPPAIAIEQKVKIRTSRSTVGTTTEIYDYLKILYARIGKTISPTTGKEIKKHTINDIVNEVTSLEDGSKILIISKINIHEDAVSELQSIKQQGFNNLFVDNELIKIDDYIKIIAGKKIKSVKLVIDRLKTKKDDNEFISRLTDSIETALYEGFGICYIHNIETSKEMHFSNKFEENRITFEEPTIHLFSFNNPLGACPKCEGFGSVIGIDPNLVIPDKNLSVYEGAVACWKGEKNGEWLDEFILSANKFDFPLHKPFYKLTEEQKNILWTGNEFFHGINDFFKNVEENTYKIQYRVLLARYRGKTICPYCKGTRVRKEANYVKIGGYSISELLVMSIENLKQVINSLKFSKSEQQVATPILREVNSRLQFLIDVGLPYLTLNRQSSTLSGGESQRINLACSLGSSLVGSLYILDEPSIGLHSRDTHRLIKILKELRDLGNTVIVVEHDKEIIKAADEIIDLGPYAGRNGGELLFQGSYENLINKGNTLTSEFFSGRKLIPMPTTKRKWSNFIEIEGASENNLKNITAKFPIGILTVVTGVSGSGKSSLVKNILFSSLAHRFNGASESTGNFGKIHGDWHLINCVEFVDQNPIGKSSRSNPVTYIKAYDEIRKLYSEQKASKLNGFKPSHFSFNVPGGRCEECQGDGVKKIEMQFMSDVYVVCESCGGKRFREEVLEIKYRCKNIYDILEMTVDEAIEFFGCKAEKTEKNIVETMKPLQKVGLGYVKLGQSSSILSGGESQRVKLASFLAKDKNSKPTVFVFDEPTTGLHIYDIDVLLKAINELIDHGHTVIIIEHNTDVIKAADWVIDLGPEGGDKGGYILFEGTPEDLKKCKESYTAKYL